MTEQETKIKALLDHYGVYPDHGDDLYMRVSMLWDDWLIEYRKNRGIPLTPEEAEARRT